MVIVAALLALAMATGAWAKKKKKNKAQEETPAVEAATFEVYGTYVHELRDFGFGEQTECDLQVYVVEGGEPVTDATVTVGDVTAPHDTFMPGRYRVQQQCAEPGDALQARVVRGNQEWTQSLTMIGYPTLTAPSAGDEAAVDQDLRVSWQNPEGGRAAIVTLTGVDGQWSTTDTSLTIPRDEVPPYQHHELILQVLGAKVDPGAARQVVSNGEPVWRSIVPVTLARVEFDYGPGLVDQNWVGDAPVIQWSDERRGWVSKLHKAWLRLYEGGSYDIQVVAIGRYEQGMANGTEISWEEHDTGTYVMQDGGVLALTSDDGETTWTATYSEPTISLQWIMPPTEDKEEIKRRKGLGRIKPWVLEVGEVESVSF